MIVECHSAALQTVSPTDKLVYVATYTSLVELESVYDVRNCLERQLMIAPCIYHVYMHCCCTARRSWV